MPEISLPAEDVAELADFLRFLDEWVTAGHDQLSRPLALFMEDHPYGIETLRHDLGRFRLLLSGGGSGGVFLGSRHVRDQKTRQPLRPPVRQVQ